MLKRILIAAAFLAVFAISAVVITATQASADTNVDAGSSSVDNANMHDYHKCE